MTVKELIEVLQDATDDSAKVFIVSQPDRHALQYRVAQVEVVNDDVFVVEGGQVGYLSGDLVQELNL